MAKDSRISVPSSMGGIVRYMDERTSNFVIAPEMVLYIIAGTILFFGILMPLL